MLSIIIIAKFAAVAGAFLLTTVTNFSWMRWSGRKLGQFYFNNSASKLFSSNKRSFLYFKRSAMIIR